MRASLVTIAVALLGTSWALADDDAKKSPPVNLKAGDPAPPFKPTKWLAGKEVNAFEPGKVYVVEFWATWCGPCIAMMPHLGDMQEELASKGVTIIGFTANDPNNSLEKVIKFLDMRAGKLGYSIAYADNRETYDAYMKASGNGGIPCSYVIDKEGKLAFIGHPMFLDEVLPKVLAGTWDATKGKAELEAADKLWDETYAAISKPGNPAAQLVTWEAFSARWPRLAADPYMNAARLKLLIAAKKTADAKQLADTMLTKAVKRNDFLALGNVSDAVAAVTDQPELASLGVRAAEALLALDATSVISLIRVAKAYTAAGDTANAEKYGPMAIAAAEKAIKGDKDAMGTIFLASAYAAIGNKEKAMASAEKAVRMVEGDTTGMKRYVDEQAKKYGVTPAASEKK